MAGIQFCPTCGQQVLHALQPFCATCGADLRRFHSIAAGDQSGVLRPSGPTQATADLLTIGTQPGDAAQAEGEESAGSGVGSFAPAVDPVAPRAVSVVPTPMPLAVALVAAGTALLATALPWVTVDGFTSRSALEGAGLVVLSPIASLVVGFFLRSNLPTSVTVGGVYLLRAAFLVATVCAAIVFATLSPSFDNGFETVRTSDVVSMDIGPWVYLAASMVGLVASLVLRWDGANGGVGWLQPGSDIGPVYFGPPPDLDA